MDLSSQIKFKKFVEKHFEKNAEGNRIDIESIALGSAFEVFFQMNPGLDLKMLEEPSFKKKFIKQVKDKIRKDYGAIINFVDKHDASEKDENDEIPFQDIIPDSAPQTDTLIDSSFSENQLTPLDMIGTDPKPAILLLEKFFDLPVFEKEAYRLFIIKKCSNNEISQLNERIKTIMGDEGLYKKSYEDKEKDKLKSTKHNKEIRQLEKTISDLIDRQEKALPIQDVFNETGILTLQRRAFIRIKRQWKQIAGSIMHDLKNNE